MSLAVTEQRHAHVEGLDRARPDAIVRMLCDGQTAAASAVSSAAAGIRDGAAAMAATLRVGGRPIYVAAGSSGPMAAADALELVGTFAIPTAQIQIHIAGGMPTGSEMLGSVEDDTSTLETALTGLRDTDTAIAVIDIL